MRGLMTLMSLIGMPSNGAIIRRVWNGTWVAVLITMRSSESSHAMEMCGSIGAGWT